MAEVSNQSTHLHQESEETTPEATQEQPTKRKFLTRGSGLAGGVGKASQQKEKTPIRSRQEDNQFDTSLHKNP